MSPMKYRLGVLIVTLGGDTESATLHFSNGRVSRILYSCYTG